MVGIKKRDIPINVMTYFGGSVINRSHLPEQPYQRLVGKCYTARKTTTAGLEIWRWGARIDDDCLKRPGVFGGHEPTNPLDTPPALPSHLHPATKHPKNSRWVITTNVICEVIRVQSEQGNRGNAMRVINKIWFIRANSNE